VFAVACQAEDFVICDVFASTAFVYRLNWLKNVSGRHLPKTRLLKMPV
jgi:hypothetical protein